MRGKDKSRPERRIAEGGAGDRIGGNPRWVVVGSPGDEPRSEMTEQTTDAAPALSPLPAFRRILGLRMVALVLPIVGRAMGHALGVFIEASVEGVQLTPPGAIVPSTPNAPDRHSRCSRYPAASTFAGIFPPRIARLKSS